MDCGALDDSLNPVMKAYKNMLYVVFMVNIDPSKMETELDAAQREIFPGEILPKLATLCGITNPSFWAGKYRLACQISATLRELDSVRTRILMYTRLDQRIVDAELLDFSTISPYLFPNTLQGHFGVTREKLLVVYTRGMLVFIKRSISSDFLICN